jgi:alpha-glucosidase
MSDWWKHGIVYQIYPRSFQDTNGDGIGDLPGIIERLDYLEWLGVDALWISPFYPSPMADFGYDVADYTDVDPIFGTLKDAERLIDEAHRHGLKVIFDYVVNHTSDQHPWFLASRSSRDHPKRDWYFWKDPAPDGGPPTNWVSRFGGGSAWEFDATTEQYYLHTYLAAQPDLNWGNPEVQQAMLDVLRFWMARGVDGFRVDVAYRAMTDPQWKDNPPNPDWKEGMDPYKKLQETYTKNLPDAHVVGRMLRETVNEYDDTVLIGEVTLPVDEMMAFYGDRVGDESGDGSGDGSGEGDEYHLPFNFNLIHSDWTAEAVQAHVERYEAVVPDHGWPNYVLGNHDQHRLATRIGPRQARNGHVLLLTLRGTPTLYYGDELGMPNVEVPPDRVQDPWEKQAPGLGLGRDPARTPMQWNPSSNAGFTDKDATPWLPVGDDFPTRNVTRQQDDPASELAMNRRLIALRRSTDALHGGRYRSLDAPDGVFAYERTGSDDRFLVALNFTSEAATWTLPEDAAPATLHTTTRMDRNDTTVDGETVDLRPDEGVVVRVE